MVKMAKTTKKIAAPKVEVEEAIAWPELDNEWNEVETPTEKVEKVVVKTRANSGIDVN